MNLFTMINDCIPYLAIFFLFFWKKGTKRKTQSVFFSSFFFSGGIIINKPIITKSEISNEILFIYFFINIATRET